MKALTAGWLMLRGFSHVVGGWWTIRTRFPHMPQAEREARVQQWAARFLHIWRIGLDVRGTTLAARGWTKEGGDLWETLARLDAAGCSRYVVTDVTKDGTLRGPNLDLLREVCARTDAPVVASGGVSSLDDLRALRTLVPVGVDSAIVGKALYAGAFTLPEALDVAGRP